MVDAIPVLVRLTIVNGKERYSNNNISPSADDADIHALALALNGLQRGAPADMFIKTEKFELIGG